MTGPRGEQPPRHRGLTRQDRQAAVAALSERAAAQVRSLVTGVDWEAWLRLAARLPGQSFTNVMLIAAQRSAATMLAGYEAWQAQGRQVRKGEPGIQVITGFPASDQLTGWSPSPATSTSDRPVKPGRRPQLTYLWDISQTGGPVSADRVTPAPATSGPPPGLPVALTLVARRAGFAVGRSDSGSGRCVTNWSSRRIQIDPGLSDTETVAALVHELAHVHAHDALAVVPGASTAGFRGIQKVEADSVAFIVATRLGLDTSGCSWPCVASWAGTDPRARPLATVFAAGARIVAAAATITAHLDAVIGAASPQITVPAPDPSPQPPEPATSTEKIGERTVATGPLPAPRSLRAEIADLSAARLAPAGLGRLLLDAERFYLDHLTRSWVPAYLESRGLGQPAWTRWRVGYAPAGWTELVNHLRGLGHDDHMIETVGLGRRSSRGTLIDHFRNRVMLAIRDEHGTIAGFIGRAHPQAGPRVPKYLNSPETPAFTKGDLLFGLSEARRDIGRGAVPVIAEGPFDAIAIGTASEGRHAGVAPCGTALTSRQAAALARVADLPRTGVLLALDGDYAGRAAAVRAHTVLLSVTGNAAVVILPPGRDPAEVLQADGPAALRRLLQHHVAPLAQVVIDAQLDTWAEQLDHAEGRLSAMRSTATVIANLLPPDTADRILQITGGRTVVTLDEGLRSVPSPELPLIARILPASATCQIVRLADRLGTEYSEVIAETVNVIARGMADPERTLTGDHRNPVIDTQPRNAEANPARIASVVIPTGSPAAMPSTSRGGHARRWSTRRAPGRLSP